MSRPGSCVVIYHYVQSEDQTHSFIFLSYQQSGGNDLFRCLVKIQILRHAKTVLIFHIRTKVSQIWRCGWIQHFVWFHYCSDHRLYPNTRLIQTWKGNLCNKLVIFPMISRGRLLWLQKQSSCVEILLIEGKLIMTTDSSGWTCKSVLVHQQLAWTCCFQAPRKLWRLTIITQCSKKQSLNSCFHSFLFLGLY